MAKEAWLGGKRKRPIYVARNRHTCARCIQKANKKTLFPLHNKKNNVPSTILVYPEGKQKKGLLVCKKEAYLMGKRGIFA